MLQVWTLNDSLEPKRLTPKQRIDRICSD